MSSFLKNKSLAILAVASFCFVNHAHAAEVLHVLSGGQSLSVGFLSKPALSTTPMHNTFMLGPNVVDGVGTELLPLKEVVSTSSIGETPSSGIANSLSMYDPIKRKIAITLHGKPGTEYLGLKMGTAPFNLGIQQAKNVRAAVIKAGDTYTPIAVTITHGESDQKLGKAATYGAALVEWQRDYQNQMRAVTGNTTLNLPMLITQMNTAKTGEVANQQLAAARANLDKIILVGPKYQYRYVDKLHLTNIHSKHVGEMNAKVIKQIFFDKKRWLPVMPTYAGRTNNVIKLSYNVPVGNLVIDTQTVAARPNYGFSFVQTGGNSATVKIQSISLVGKDVYVTLNAVPTGTAKKIQYAWAPTIACDIHRCGGAETSGFVGGNIRDQDARISPAKNSTRLPLYNWSVAFSQNIN